MNQDDLDNLVKQLEKIKYQFTLTVLWGSLLVLILVSLLCWQHHAFTR